MTTDSNIICWICTQIFLIDVKDDHFSQSCSEGRSVDSGEVNIFLQNHSPKIDVALGSGGVPKKAQPTVENANQTSVMRSGAESQKCGLGSGNETEVNGSVTICPGESALRCFILIIIQLVVIAFNCLGIY